LKNTLINAAKYSFGLALGAFFLYLAFRNADAEEIWQAVRAVKPGWLLASLAVGLFSHFLRGVRWQMQLQASGYSPSKGNLFAAVMTGYMVNQALPRAGEIARCSVLYKSDRVPLTKALGTVVIERVFDLLILVVLICVAFALEFDTIQRFFDEIFGAKAAASSGPPTWLLVMAAVGLVGMAGLWLLRVQLMKLSLVQRVVTFGQELFQSALSIRYLEHPWRFVLYTFGIWVCYWMMTYVAFYSMPPFAEVEMGLLYLSLITTVIGGIGMAMPVPGGTGPYHFAVKFTFIALLVAGSREASETLGQSFAVVMHSSQLIMMVVAGLIGYAYLWFKPSQDSSLERDGPLEGETPRAHLPVAKS
jgi:hypothetical protein